LELPYVIKIAITKQPCTTCNHWPEAFPFALLNVRDAGVSFDILIARIPKLWGRFLRRSHHMQYWSA